MIAVNTDAGADGDDCGFYSKHAFDFSDSAVTLELVEVPDGSEAWLGVGDPDDEFDLVIDVYDGDLEALVVSGGSWDTVASVPFNPVAHRFIQLREAAGTAYWQFSADGQSWTDLHSQATPFSVEMEDVFFGAGATGYQPNALSIELDNFNILP